MTVSCRMRKNQLSGSRILVFVFILSCLVYWTPGYLSNPLMLFLVLTAPAWSILLSLEESITSTLSFKSWYQFIKLLGAYYWIMALTLLMICSLIYYFLFVSSGFIPFLLSIYLLLFYHRFVGLVLRQNDALIHLPKHWKLSTKSKKEFINKPLVIKYQRIIQDLYRKEPGEIFDEKLLLLMRRKNYQESNELFEALSHLEDDSHALRFCQHYLMQLTHNLTENAEQIDRVLSFCFIQNENFLLDKDMQNVLLAQSLVKAWSK